MTDVAVERWLWTADGYQAAAAAGVFAPDLRVELIDGEVYQMASMLAPHAATVARLLRLLMDRLDGADYTISGQTPVRTNDRSEPEPDVWVADGPVDRYDDHHPTRSELLLVVEVSDTTRRFDRSIKVPHYAAAGIAELWIVSLSERAIHRYREPRGGEYRSVIRLDRGVLEVAGVDVPVDAVLPTKAR